MVWNELFILLTVFNPEDSDQVFDVFRVIFALSLVMPLDTEGHSEANLIQIDSLGVIEDRLLGELGDLRVMLVNKLN